MEPNFWDQNAQAWAEVIRSQGIASRAVTTQALLQKIFSPAPESVLDLGCGEGFLSAEVRKRNIFYHGVDASPKLIEIARREHGDFFSAVSYEDLRKKNWQAPRPFDLAVFNFSLFAEKISPLLQAVRSLLKPDGRVLIQTLHPCFALPVYRSAWNKEDFKTMSVPFSGSMDWYGRTLQDWFQEFAQSQWRVESLQEPLLDARPASIIFELRNV